MKERNNILEIHFVFVKRKENEREEEEEEEEEEEKEKALKNDLIERKLTYLL